LVTDLLGAIGGTPCCRLVHLPGPDCAEAVVKLESRSPGGSVKDRAALAMVRAAERDGRLRPGGTLIEATSGNTGVSLALVGAALGYRVVVVMPEVQGHQKARLIRALGGQVRLTPSLEGFVAAREVANNLASASNCFMPDQWGNAANMEAHRTGTGPEILEATEGRLDAFVAGVGTGGTLTGVGRCLRQRLPGCKLVAVEPCASPVLSGGKPGLTRISGLGPGFVPPLLEVNLIDEVLTVTDDEALETARLLTQREGISAGPSAGANVAAALRIARRLGPGRRVVTVIPDAAERYL
jgi:cysteine synthase A